MTPLDTWLVCGKKVDADRKGCGCTCHPADPTAKRVQEALNRLSREKIEGRAS